jgi:hypothetical protein
MEVTLLFFAQDLEHSAQAIDGGKWNHPYAEPTRWNYSGHVHNGMDKHRGEFALFHQGGVCNHRARPLGIDKPQCSSTNIQDCRFRQHVSPC